VDDAARMRGRHRERDLLRDVQRLRESGLAAVEAGCSAHLAREVLS
jgi:hypothetical protein